ncbi:TPA: hypothetical protein ACQUHH_003939 [Bacillus mobilis]
MFKLKDIVLTDVFKTEKDVINSDLLETIKINMKRETDIKIIREDRNEIEFRYKSVGKIINSNTTFSIRTEGNKVKIDVVGKQNWSKRAYFITVINCGLLVTGLFSIFGIAGLIFLLVKINGATKVNTGHLEKILGNVKSELLF